MNKKYKQIFSIRTLEVQKSVVTIYPVTNSRHRRLDLSRGGDWIAAAPCAGG